MICFGSVPAGSVLPVMFTTYAGSTGASVTLTGLAVTDIEVYKGTSMTQRASDAGYTLLDTDGIDIDSITGLHGFSIDTGDNTDSGFYAAGSFYTVVVSAVTVDSQTVNFIAATFRLAPAESVAGTPKVDVSHFGGTAGTFASGRPEVNTTHAAGTAWGSGAITAASIAADAITDAKVAADVTIASVTGSVGSVTGNVGGNVVGSVGSVAADGISASSLAASAGSEIATAVRTELTTELGRIDVATSTRLASASYTAPLDAAGTRAAVGLASANLDTQLAAIDDAVDTEVGAIKAVTDKLDTALELDGAVYRYTTNALELAPTGGSAPTASQIADEVQTRTIAAVTTVNGLAANTITAAALAADAGTEIGTAVWASAARTLTAIDEDSTTLDLDATIRGAVGLASANLDTQFGDLPTATENADALLNRDMSAVSDTNARSPLNALRFIRNKWSVSGTTLTVTKEDDTTSAWTATVTATPGADPITGNDPA